MKYRRMYISRKLFFFLLGAAVGIVVFYLGGRRILEEKNILSACYIEWLRSEGAGSRELLMYLLPYRMVLLGLIFLALRQPEEKIGSCFFFSVLGFSAGVLWLACILTEETNGNSLFLLLFFPHGIFYFMALKYGCEVGKRRPKALKKLLRPWGCLAAGLLTETYVHPMVMKWLLLK